MEGLRIAVVAAYMWNGGLTGNERTNLDLLPIRSRMVSLGGSWRLQNEPISYNFKHLHQRSNRTFRFSLAAGYFGLWYEVCVARLNSNWMRTRRKHRLYH
jgi:hypothetical protein